MPPVAEPVEKVAVIEPAILPQGESQQPPEEVDPWTPQHSIRPPEDLDNLAALTQGARTRRSCIEAIAVNTVGLGFDVVPREGMEEDAADEEIAEAKAKLNALARRDMRLGRPSFKRLLSAVKWDEEEVGNGYLEVSRNRLSGDIDGLFHVPGKRARRRKDRKGWVVGPKDGIAVDRREFYDFGSKVKYDAQGRPEGKLAEPGMRWDRNEIIAFQLFTSESRDYGLPRDAHLALDYLGDRRAAETNASFFDSSGVPPTVIFIKGEAEDAAGNKVRFSVSPKTVEAITDTLKSDGSRRHRVAVIPLPPGSDASEVNLASLSERDMGFVEYRKDNRRACLGAFRLAPIFVADIEDTNYSTAEIEMRVTKGQVFDVEQDRWEDIVSETILRDLGYAHLEMEFTELDITDPETVRENVVAGAEAGVVTNGEFRSAISLPPLPEADETAEGEEPEPGQVEHGWNAKLVTISVKSNAQPDVQKGVEAAAQLLAEGSAVGAVGIESGH